MNEFETRLAESMHDMIGVMQKQSDYFHDNMCKTIDALERLELRMIAIQEKLVTLTKLMEAQNENN